MLRKGLILLAISLTVSLAAQAQAPAGGAGGGAPGGGAPGGGAPGGGAPGGGAPGGGTPGGGRPGGGTNDPFGQQEQQQRQMERPIFLSGNVILASGEVPLEPIMINRVCGMQKTPEGFTDSKGRFSFQVGSNQQFAAMDASIGSQGANSGLGNGGFGGGGMGNGGFSDTGMGIDLSGCQLEAVAPGYRSDPIFLTRRRPMDRAEVGTIILTPLGGMQQESIVSATSLAAPKKAKASFEKGIKELNKGASARLDKAMEELQSAVTEYPQYAAAWTTLGQAKAQSGDTEGAIAALEKALDADPRYLRPYEPLIRLYIGKGDWQQTAELTKFVVGVNPADTKMRWYQAVSTFEIGRDDDAVTMLSEIQKDAEGDKQFPQSHHIMGLIYAKRGQFGQAAESFNRYLELDPNAQAAEAIKKQLNEWQQLGVL